MQQAWGIVQSIEESSPPELFINAYWNLSDVRSGTAGPIKWSNDPTTHYVWLATFNFDGVSPGSTPSYASDIGPITLQLDLPETIPDSGDVVFKTSRLLDDMVTPPLSENVQTFIFPGPHVAGSSVRLDCPSFIYRNIWLDDVSKIRCENWAKAYPAGSPHIGLILS